MQLRRFGVRSGPAPEAASRQGGAPHWVVGKACRAGRIGGSCTGPGFANESAREWALRLELVEHRKPHDPLSPMGDTFDEFLRALQDP